MAEEQKQESESKPEESKSAEKLVTMDLQECRIPKRGKGAKGSVEAQVFGVLEIDEKTGVLKNVKYTGAEKLDTEALILKLSDLGEINEILLRGVNQILRSAAIKSQATMSQLQQKIIREGHCDTRKEAKKLAAALISMRKNIVEMGYEPQTFDEMLAKRKAKLAAEKPKS